MIENDSTNYIAKKYERNDIENNEYLKLLKNEIVILQNLNHQNIIKFIDTKKTKKSYYLMLEYCNGGNLSQILEKYQQKYGKPFSLEIIQHLMRQIIDAFNYLHQKKVIHNNINLNNILINYEDEKDEKEMNLLKSNVKIIDFKFGSKFNNMLKANVFVYTKNKNQPSFKNDNFNLGKLCYKMLFGKYAINDNIDDNNNTDNIDNIKKIIEEIEEGKCNYPITLSKEIISFLEDIFRMNYKILKIDELSEHEFLNKNIKDFQLINK